VNLLLFVAVVRVRSREQTSDSHRWARLVSRFNKCPWVFETETIISSILLRSTKAVTVNPERIKQNLASFSVPPLTVVSYGNRNFRGDRGQTCGDGGCLRDLSSLEAAW
jgi:hypothetical protein